MFKTGTSIEKLQQVATQHRIMGISIYVESDGVLKECFIETSKTGQDVELHIRQAPNLYQGTHERVDSIRTAFSKAAETLSTMKADLDSSYVSSNDADLFALVRSCWCEAFGLDENSSIVLTRAQADAHRKSVVQKSLLALIDSGSVQLWNSRPDGEKLDSGLDFSKRNMSDKNLSGMKFGPLNWSGSNFDRSKLVKASFIDADVTRATFKKCDFEGANLSAIVASRADFSDCGMKSIFCHNGNFKNANFTSVDLSGSQIKDSDLRGADLSSANLSNVSFSNTKYDEKTKLPADINRYGLVWKGAGADPAQEAALKASLGQVCTDFAGFLLQLEKNFDPERLKKSLSMLKKERFQLYSDITADSVTGIVSSQSDEGLIYACQLASNGAYTCCTQNLKPCGGLRGSLCKHLLVLVIGLTKSEALEPNTSSQWVLSSKFMQAKIDKEQMTSIFLRYKGAEAGEIDWRPTETIPEDYYS